MKDKIMQIVMAIVIIEILLLTVGSVFAMLGLFGFNTGCVYRYDLSGSSVPSDSIAKVVTIRADGNYSSNITRVNGINTITTSPNLAQYGQWKRAGVNVTEGQQVTMAVQGAVSLCKSYLPAYNIGNDGNHDQNNNPIPIPRISDPAGLTLIFDASKTPGWRNLLQIYPGDIVEVAVSDNPSSVTLVGGISAITAPDIFTGQTINANCSQNQQSYSPVCGRWSMWNGSQAYVNSCTYNDAAEYPCSHRCCHYALGTCWDGAIVGINGGCFNSCVHNSYTTATLPSAYSESGSVTMPGGTSVPTFPAVCGGASQCADLAACNNNCSSANYTNACNTSCTCNFSCTTTDATQCNGSATCEDQANLQNSCAQCVSSGGANTLASCTAKYTNCSNNAFNQCVSSCKSASITSCQATCEAAASGASSGICAPDDGNSGTQVCSCLGVCGNADAGVQACASATATYDTSVAQSWFSARDVGGLWTRSSSRPVNRSIDMSAGSTWASIMNPADEYTQDQYTGRKLISRQYGAIGLETYLQYRFYADPSDTTGASYANHTGGYVFQVKHTKCFRQNGAFISDSGYASRGQVLYVISNTNPNTIPPASPPHISIDAHGNADSTIIVPEGMNGDIWFKIDNNLNDYPDSMGSYNVSLSFINTNGGFITTILSPLINLLKNRVDTAGLEIFKNLLCYNKQINGSCTNFFNYIKAMLTLYIMTYGMMFLTGMVKASYQDVVIRIVKIGLVAGLMSGETFIWFQDNVFKFIIDFTDQIIANFGGFSSISSVNSPGVEATNYTGASNISGAAGPFMFIDTIFTKIFLTQTFTVQMLAVMGIGLIGILYFIIIGVGIAIMVIVCLRAISVYIIAMLATAFLISLSPIFLTFMLFKQTFYLFENWYKALFRYMMEPVILLIGTIVLVQIFTMYMDSVLAYSACWKCAIPFYMPFASLVPLPGLQDIPLFCINWFAPWGVDNTGNSGQIGMDLSSMLGLVILAFAMYGYGDLAQQMAAQLTSAGANAPSSIGTGNAMSHSIGQAALRRVGLDDKTQADLKEEQVKNRAASRQAIKDRPKELDKREKEIEKEEKKLGIFKEDPSKPLKKTQNFTSVEGLKGAATNLANTAKYKATTTVKGVKDSATNFTDTLGITKRDPLKNPDVQKAVSYVQAQQAAEKLAMQAGAGATAAGMSPEVSAAAGASAANAVRSANTALSESKNADAPGKGGATVTSTSGDGKSSTQQLSASESVTIKSGGVQPTRASIPDTQVAQQGAAEALKSKTTGERGEFNKPTAQELEPLKGKTREELSEMRAADLEASKAKIADAQDKIKDTRDDMIRAKKDLSDFKQASYVAGDAKSEAALAEKTQKYQQATEASIKAVSDRADAQKDFYKTQNKYDVARRNLDRDEAAMSKANSRSPKDIPTSGDRAPDDTATNADRTPNAAATKHATELKGGDAGDAQPPARPTKVARGPTKDSESDV